MLWTTSTGDCCDGCKNITVSAADSSYNSNNNNNNNNNNNKKITIIIIIIILLPTVNCGLRLDDKAVHI